MVGGPESESKPLTNEYCAFHCLGVALDYAKLRRKREDHPEAFRTPSVHSSPVHRSIRSSANSTRIGRASGQYATPSRCGQSISIVGNRGDPVEAAREVAISAGGGVVGLSTREASPEYNPVQTEA